MLASSAFRRRVLGACGVAATIVLVLLAMSTPATAKQTPPSSDWPVIEMANPSPGAVLPSGDILVSGTAYDPAATDGAGVSRVELFLGDRDSGGVFLGSATPGVNLIPGTTPNTRLAQTGFQIKVTLPSNTPASQDFTAYAYSSVTGLETSVSMPIYVGAAPTATPSGTTASAPPSAETLQIMPAVAPGVMFSLANPSAGDVVLHGDYIVSGSTSAAMDRIEFFLGTRESGGTLLTAIGPVNGAFSVKVTIPNGALGAHDFVVYARASDTGVEATTSVPIYIGAAPTPTPRPSTSSTS